MLRPAFVAAALLLAQLSFGQNQAYTAAKIKTSSGTLEGFIRNASDASTPQSFSFATDKAGPYRAIAAPEIERVELADGSIYERHYIEVPVLAIPELDRRKYNYSLESYFKGGALVQKIVSGKLSLYTFDDRYENAHFFYTENADTALSILPFEPYVTENSTIEGATAFRNPLGRLAITMGCAEGVRRDVATVAHTERSLVQFFQRLNLCDGGKAATVAGSTRTRVRFGAMAGGTLQFKSTAAKEGFRPSSEVSAFNPAIGAFADTYTGRSNESNLFTVGLYFSPVSRSTVYTYPYNGFYATASQKDKLTGNQVGLELSARHLFGSSNIRPFIEGGFLVHSTFSQKITTIITDTNGNSQVTETPTAGSHIGLEALAGGGLQLNRGSLHLRYSRGVSAESISSVSFSLRVRF
jgi:hypothetical protein